MIVALFIVGLMLVVTGLRGTYAEFGRLLAEDFTGPGNFWYFIFGILFLGMLGYYAPLRNTSRLLIALALLVFVLSNAGFWVRLREAVETPLSPASAPDNPVPEAAPITEASADVAIPQALNVVQNALSSIQGVASGGGIGGAVSAVNAVRGVLSLFG